MKALELKDCLISQAVGDLYRKLAACYRFGRGGLSANEKVADQYEQIAADWGNVKSVAILEWFRANDNFE